MESIDSEMIFWDGYLQLEGFSCSFLTLRIKVCPFRKGLGPRSIPMIENGWDWNPKNPIRSGGVWILRVN